MEDSVILSISREEAAALSGIYQLLARLWLREVDAEFVGKLCAPPLCDSFVQAGGRLPAGVDERTIDQLAIDYCQLFIGPANHFPPFQSVWETGQFQGATVASMSRFMEVVGYDPDVVSSGLMLDHLGIQLDLMGRLVGELSAGQRTSDERRQLLELRHTFFVKHLAWSTQLLQAAAAQAQTDFYRSIIQLTRDFLECERL